MSKLRDYIADNRRAFDGDEPPPEAWSRVEAALKQRKPARIGWRSNRNRWWMAAASVIIVAGFGWMVTSRNTDTTPPDSTGDAIFKSADAGYSLEAKRIFLQINEQQKQLKSLASDAPDLYRRFQRDLLALDSAYKQLEVQAKNTPNRDVILEAMMQNLELQAGLLQKQLQILKEYKNQNKQNETNNVRTT